MKGLQGTAGQGFASDGGAGAGSPGHEWAGRVPVETCKRQALVGDRHTVLYVVVELC